MILKEYRKLQLIRKGDISSFEKLFHEFYPGMCSYAETLVRSSEIAEEVVQDVFYNIWKNHRELNITTSFKSYLYRATFNNSMMQLRRAKRELTLDEKWAENQYKTESTFAEEMDAKELNALILYTLHLLPQRCQQIFRMSRYDGKKYKEIAEQLGISIKTVEANMGKALKALRLAIEEHKKTA